MTMTKHAGWFSSLTSSLKSRSKNPYAMAAALPVIGAVADAGMGAGIRHVRGIMDVKHKARAYKAMLAENPVLKKKGKASHKFFNTLYNANPSLAKDPLVASSWVHTQLEQQIPGVPHAGVVEGVSTLTKIRQQMQDRSSENRAPGIFQRQAKQFADNLPSMVDQHRKLGDREKLVYRSEEALKQHAARLGR